ncbi:HTH domain-containing protein [Bacillus sp. SRB3LM]|nr:HTH domain-containing protein [Bacillus sp. SRB3LM]
MLLSRQKELLSILLQNKKWYTFSELASEVKCSIKTVQRDFQIIKDILPPQWSIEVCKGKGVILHKPAQHSGIELKSLFVRGDTTYAILDAIFKGRVHSLDLLSESLYIPRSSLSHYLKHVDQYLQSFGLILKRNPLSIQGETTTVMLMYQTFYINSHGDHEWAFPRIDEASIQQYITQIEKELKIKLYPLCKRKIMYLSAILLEQKMQGKVIKLDSDCMIKITDTPFYQSVLKMNSLQNNIHFNKDELAFLILSINCSNYIHQDLVAYKKEVLQHFKNENVRIYRHIKDLIILLGNTFQQTFSENDEFIFAIIQYFKQTLSKFYFLSHIDFPFSEDGEYIKNQHHETFLKVGNIYKKWIIQYNIRAPISDEEIATLTLHVEGACMLARTLHVKVWLIIEGGEKWLMYIKGILCLHFGSIFHFKHADIQDMKNGDYTKSHTDLILTTFMSIQSSIPIIRISKIPTNRELQDIQEFIYQDSILHEA